MAGRLTEMVPLCMNKAFSVKTTGDQDLKNTRLEGDSSLIEGIDWEEFALSLTHRKMPPGLVARVTGWAREFVAHCLQMSKGAPGRSARQSFLEQLSTRELSPSQFALARRSVALILEAIDRKRLSESQRASSPTPAATHQEPQIDTHLPVLSPAPFAAQPFAPGENPLKAPFPELEERLRQQLRIQNYSARTERIFVTWIRTFGAFWNWPPPETLNETHISEFLRDLREKQGAAPSTSNQALGALLFWYVQVLNHDHALRKRFARASRKGHPPLVLSREQVKELIARLDGPYSLMARLIYGVDCVCSSVCACASKMCSLPRTGWRCAPIKGAASGLRHCQNHCTLS